VNRDRIAFLFLNLGHFFDHLLVLIFATVAALALAAEWNMSYGALIPYATPGFIAFGFCALPAGWIADKWSREGMMVIFFLGIGLSALLTALAQSPLQIGAGLLAVGVFAAIYHPVGLAMVVHGRTRTGMPLAVNGVFGNMGVAAAALIAGFLIDLAGWRAAFALPGAAAILTGLAYAAFLWSGRQVRAEARASGADRRKAAAGTLAVDRATMVRVLTIVFLSTGIGGLIFQSTTFALPKVFDERLTVLAGSASAVGWYAFLVFALAAFAQLVVGYLVDRHPVRTVFAAVAGLQAIFFAVMHELTGPPALFVSIAFMLVVFGQIPINDVLVARVARSEWRSRIYACRYVVTFSVMASAIPLVAWLHATWGFAALFAVLAVAATLILLAVLQLPTVLSASKAAPEAAGTA
jgi:MFS family permease